jgi:hypothetical protein
MEELTPAFLDRLGLTLRDATQGGGDRSIVNEGTYARLLGTLREQMVSERRKDSIRRKEVHLLNDASRNGKEHTGKKHREQLQDAETEVYDEMWRDADDQIRKQLSFTAWYLYAQKRKANRKYDNRIRKYKGTGIHEMLSAWRIRVCFRGLERGEGLTLGVDNGAILKRQKLWASTVVPHGLKVGLWKEAYPMLHSMVSLYKKQLGSGHADTQRARAQRSDISDLLRNVGEDDFVDGVDEKRRRRRWRHAVRDNNGNDQNQNQFHVESPPTRLSSRLSKSFMNRRGSSAEGPNQSFYSMNTRY